MTENPAVVDGFVDVYNHWVDLGVDGFRIDTVKHVNFEFWQKFYDSGCVTTRRAVGNDDFFMFGEVYDADPAKLSPYVRDSDMNAVLDFTFQSAASRLRPRRRRRRPGGAVRRRRPLHDADHQRAGAAHLPGQPRHGPHRLLRRRTRPSREQRSALAHSLMYLTRGQPVVYYGDEQGFVGDGAAERRRQGRPPVAVRHAGRRVRRPGPARRDALAGAVDRYDTDTVLYEHIAELAALRAAAPRRSQHGAQIERLADGAVYAFSRVDARREGRAPASRRTTARPRRRATIDTLTPGATFAPLYGTSTSVTAAADGDRRGVRPRPAARSSSRPTATRRRATRPRVTLDGGGSGGRCGARGAGPGGRHRRDGRVTPDLVRLPGGGRRHVDAAGHVGDDVAARLPHDRGTWPPARSSSTARCPWTRPGTVRRVDLRQRGRGRRRCGPGAAGRPDGRLRARQPQLRDGLPGRLAAGLRRRRSSRGATTGSVRDVRRSRPALRVQGRGRQELDRELRRGRGAGRSERDLLRWPRPRTSRSSTTRTHTFTSTAQGGIITVAGLANSELGCAGDWRRSAWRPGCRTPTATARTRSRRTELPTGSYEVKVAHDRGWTENYGAGGVPGWCQHPVLGDRAASR